MSDAGATPRLHLVPKLWTVLREGYTLARFRQDLAAGVIVGVVALPLAIAFAIASGVKPEQGLYTAVVAGFIISVFGGSRVQIGGPTGAFIVIVYAIVQQYGYEGLAVATVMAGFILIAMGLAGLGTIIEFVPYPVTVGFTSGIALIIAASQLRDFLGLKMSTVPADFLEKLAEYARHAGTASFAALGVGLLTVVIMAGLPRFSHRVPASLAALLAATLLVAVLDLPVETIGDRFGAVPQGLPDPEPRLITWVMIRQLFPSAIAIALLGAIESLLSAVVADGMLGTRHRSNMELVAQGIANVASPIFSGIPATGAIARTATNVKNGGRTPVAGIVHAATLLLIMLFFGQWASLIPMPALAGILLMVAYHMSEWRLFLRLFKSPKSDVLVLMTTFALTVLIDLAVAIEAGMVMAALMLMRRLATLSEVGYVTDMLEEKEEGADPGAVATRAIPDGVAVFEVYGTFFFGAASKFRDALLRVTRPPKVLILRLRQVPVIDATGLNLLDGLIRKCERDGTRVVLSRPQKQPLEALERAGLVNRIGRDNVRGSLDDALARSKEIIGI